MSDKELETIKRRKLKEIQRRWAARQQKKTSKTEKVDPNEVLNKIFRERAWEVFNAANHQFPNVTSRIKDILVELASTGRLKEVTGEQLYLFLRKMGLRVKLDTKIRYTEHGKLKTLADKVKEDFERL